MEQYHLKSHLKTHPCFSEEAHLKYGRIHLPVSPSCNIQCAFCKRGINKIDPVPGCTSRVLTPEEALTILGRALELCPEIKVAGVAGPAIRWPPITPFRRFC